MPEVDSLTALGNRQGATLLPQLRKAWSGEALGFAYADPNKAIPVAAHTYRLCVVLGVQPDRAGPLLDDTGGGTPQRFLWLPNTFRWHDSEAPEPVVVPPQSWPSLGRLEMPLPTEARDLIRSSRIARLEGDADALDGHALLCRAKVAVALTLLEGRRVVTSDDWPCRDADARLRRHPSIGAAHVGGEGLGDERCARACRRHPIGGCR